LEPAEHWLLEESPAFLRLERNDLSREEGLSSDRMDEPERSDPRDDERPGLSMSADRDRFNERERLKKLLLV